MGRLTRKFIQMLIFAVICAGCSVKENRSSCPCRLSLDLSGIDAVSVDSVVVTAVSEGDVVCSETVYSDSFGQKYIMLLPRSSQMRLLVLSGSEGLVDEEGMMKIPHGMDCPPVYMHAEVLNTDCESLERVIVLRKRFCRLNILVEDEKAFSFGLVLRGEVDGYLPDGSPSLGVFNYSMPKAEDGSFVVSLPRQLDGSLVLDIDDGTEVLKTFALGEYLLASGYDWNADDLKDVTVGIDYARTTLTVSVQGWDKVYEFDFVI